MRAVPDLEVFSRRDALAVGWTDSSLTRAVARGALVRPRRGRFALPNSPSERIEALAAAGCLSGSVLSHRTALDLHGLPIVGPRPRLPQVTVPPTGRGSAPGAHLHRASLPGDHVVELPPGVLATSVARTLVDVGRSCSTSTAVAAMDAALHRGTVTPDEIEEVLVRCWNWPSIRRAQRALGLADGRAESPLESVSRLVIGWLRLPAPELQAVVLDRDGRAAGRLDFYWDEWGVAGEADGRGKYTNVGVIVAEKDRQEHLENHGLVFARWGCTDATRHPRSVKQRILNAYERGRARDRSGLPREWSVQLTKAATRREDVITNPVARQLGGKT